MENNTFYLNFNEKKTEKNDIHLWSAFRNGDMEAFETIYQSYSKILLRYGRKLTNDSDLIKDCLHELFVELWSKRENLGATDSIKFYLIRSFRNKLLRQFKEEKKFNYGFELKELDIHSFDVSFEETLLSQETNESTLKNLQSAMNKLPDRQKEIIYLIFHQELSHVQVSEIMQISYQGVSNLLYKALKNLRTSFQFKISEEAKKSIIISMLSLLLLLV